MNLRITEIFFSLQGETTYSGLPTVFIRLTGCPLRCTYCDTAYAFSGGNNISIDDVITTVSNYKTKYVTVTGGEPLAQKNCLALLKKLCDLQHCVTLETSGAIDISDVDARVIKILDIKTPGSNEMSKNIFSNFNFLSKQDQIKFVICDRADYDWSKKIIAEYQLQHCCEILFSPSADQLDKKILAEWILQDQLPVRFQIQLHKYIWGDVRGR
ncbi:MAG: 7-carboxy-7-deazaguanine synthase QueE [Gammaproteobacteria bacterium RIFCSPLOWO2_02_FULL_42_14]|nr:MAG: 7-carboxy-7-deazaguanine synthase QueE [Gammaproteobacteria bacterium RIFCSPHIGHO2_02_FULL_42_43]OGT29011.1 MAG: 7-carboxy-7-deazaguanine synthase QueE [Gammaproteobacteria bacterium RIFCSPHIGHO2_01_FULL_42_8]OGT53507.1 MAG: 7-carboxy-7-deazaguanine synthase QueE [Gammaproteobacteria bacterium RIFCSPHIGHO2_12_FULL_41_25]OGT61453.1 MAG: 7-carboxy-7-deazaguanine synthase QueE [Gammaproteobacteria bacterium RIFCSPLOWO2_02_FULL_42_14]OGT86483.1 MAG: 7-carboxy-7-deazaguanine synthase QueE [G